MPKKSIFSKDAYFKMLDEMLTLPKPPQPVSLIEKLRQSLLGKPKLPRI